MSCYHGNSIRDRIYDALSPCISSSPLERLGFPKVNKLTWRVQVERRKTKRQVIKPGRLPHSKGQYTAISPAYNPCVYQPTSSAFDDRHMSKIDV